MARPQISLDSPAAARSARTAPAQRSFDVVRDLAIADRATPSDHGHAPAVRAAGITRATSTVTLLFAPGERPGIAQLRALASAERSFLVSFDPQEEASPAGSAPARLWLELLTDGLAFDCEGLAPGLPQPLPPGTHRYDLPPDFDLGALEAVSLRPAPHFTNGRTLAPVVRALASLAAELAGLPGVRAVAWHAARSVSGPEHFRRSVRRWTDGGAFPGLGLTALVPSRDGGIESEGLSLLTGQELRLAPELARDRAACARLALRLLHWMVEHGRVDTPISLPGPSGEMLSLEPLENKRLVAVSLK